MVWVGWGLVLALTVALLGTLGETVVAVLTYAAVWGISTAGPGILLWRALSRPTSLAQDLGFGPVLGVALLLPAWAVAISVGLPWLMWLWPAGVGIAFTVVPSLRRHWRPQRAPHLRTSVRWHVAMAVVSALSLSSLYLRLLQQITLPPKATHTFQDIWYELSLVEALGRSVAIQDPAVAGEPLRYHWFANAHVAATQLLSGLPAAPVVFHLWTVAMLLSLVFALAAATDRILRGPSGRDPAGALWWPGPLVVVLATVLPATLFLSQPRLPGIDNGFVVSSTSGLLALVVVLAATGPVLDLLHGRSAKAGTWAVLVALLLLSIGTKPSLLPVFACGGLMVLLAQGVQRRRLPTIPLLLTVLPLILIPPAALTVFGSTGGSRLQLLQTLALDPSFQRTAGNAVGRPGHGGWLAPGLADGPGRIWPVAAVLLTLFVLTELPRLLGLCGAGARQTRDDPGTWWCFGVVGSGFAGLWVLSHPAYSQHYFWRIVIPLGVVLTVTTAIRQLPWPHRGTGRPVLGFAAAGLLTALVLRLVFADPVEPPDPILGRLVPYAVAAVVLSACLLGYRRLPRPAGGSGWRDRRCPGSPPVRRPGVTTYVAVVSFVCGLAVLQSTLDLVPPAQAAVAGSSTARTVPVRYVTVEEQEAAAWLREHSEPTDVVATNVFCAPQRYAPDCRHVSFWLAGLTGRQLFLGGWAYTGASLAAYGEAVDQEGSYQQVAAPWPQRLELSLRTVRDPSAADIAALRAQGVTWIFADRRATEVSTRLSDMATLSYRNADVLVYRLDVVPPVKGTAPNGPRGDSQAR